MVQLDREHPDFVEVLLSRGVPPDFVEDVRMSLGMNLYNAIHLR